MQSDDITAPNPVCPNCGRSSVRVFTGKMVCNDCHYAEAVAHLEDEGEGAFMIRLAEVTARWRTTPDRMLGGEDYDPYDDPA